MSGSDEAKRGWVERVLRVRLSPVVTPSDGAAMKRWQDERNAAVSRLRLLANEIVKAEDPEARQAVILLQAIIKNLTPAPPTLQSVVELESYVTDDNIFDDVEQPNPFGVELKLRATLLPAITALRQEYSAVQS
jgi:hypothetical protein